MDTWSTHYLTFNQLQYSKNNCILKVISARINSLFPYFILDHAASDVFSHGLQIMFDIKVQIIRL